MLLVTPLQRISNQILDKTQGLFNGFTSLLLVPELYLFRYSELTNGDTTECWRGAEAD